MNFDKIFIRWKDKNVGSFVVYGDSTDHKLYNKASGDDKVQVKEAELKDLFKTGRLLIVVGTKMYRAIYVDANKAGVVDTVSSAVAIVEYLAVAA